MKLTREQIIQKFAESLPKHLGHSKLISQMDMDQGDTSQRVGTLIALISILDDDAVWDAFQASGHPGRADSLDLLKAGFGIYRRSPDPSYWGYNPNNLSRDQLSILKIGASAMGDTGRVGSIAFRHALRFGFHQNWHPGTDAAPNHVKIPDITSPGEVMVYLRTFLGPISIIPNHILDLTLLIDLQARKTHLWDADNMMSMHLLFSNWKHPTLWSKLAMKYYLKTDFMARLWNYHKDEAPTNGCEPLYWLFRLTFLDRYGYEPGDTAP